MAVPCAGLAQVIPQARRDARTSVPTGGKRFITKQGAAHCARQQWEGRGLGARLYAHTQRYQIALKWGRIVVRPHQGVHRLDTRFSRIPTAEPDMYMFVGCLVLACPALIVYGKVK